MTNNKELNDEELEKVSGGTNTKEQGSKYKKDMYVKYVGIGGMLINGRIVDILWSDTDNQYLYCIKHEEIRFLVIDSKEVKFLEAGEDDILESEIKYEL